MLSMDKFSERLKQAWIESGMTQGTFAWKSGVTAASINKILNGWHFPTLETAVAMANALNLSLDYLLRTEDD